MQDTVQSLKQDSAAFNNSWRKLSLLKRSISLFTDENKRKNVISMSYTSLFEYVDVLTTDA